MLKKKKKFTLSGTQVMSEGWTVGSVRHLMIYVYDAEESPVGFRYRNSTYNEGEFKNYIYGKNVQGDIIYIFNANGDKVAEFGYDAWGNPVSTNYYNSNSNPGVTYSPFRYRGYWYDEETGLYYLNSRYYNPEWGRFLNADVYVCTGSGLLGYNMFAYCRNNPVTLVDPNGNFPWLIFLVATVLALTPILSCCNSSPTTGNGPENETDGYQDDPFLSIGRYHSFEEAVDQASADMKEYANNHNKEVGCFIYELYGGYYISQPQSGILATETSVRIDLSRAPSDSNVLATFHSHPWHNDNILYTPIEYDNVVNLGIPSYVTDVCGCTYVLSPDAKNYMDYKKIK